ncbi:50S ribosomal protein L22 [Candidatus Saccharibacteria bacterium RIFCSPHIGHO2_12_FULL_41_12]|nr:MAG: 50S ribosomal protein L22 [Candidatus Saccharibacteria bacterium RIFCSPHIGHO2_12_FULL_41_12]
MSVKAVAKNVRISPRKVAIVAGLVRGRSVEDALTILSHTPRRSATAVKKTIESARANAENNHNYKAETLQIVYISVTPGTKLKRFRPAAHGRALPFQRKSSHITVHVDGEMRGSKKTDQSGKETKKEANPATKKPDKKKITKKETK